jgi:hypothetical protein
MQYCRNITLIASVLFAYPLAANAEKKEREKELNTITKRYQEKNATIHKKYACMETQYDASRKKNAIAARCSKESLSLPELIDLAATRPEQTTSFHPSMIPENDVLYFLEETVSIAKEDLMSKELWVTGKTPYNGHFFNTTAAATFKPFMQKIIVPTGSTFFVWGDTHGCIHSLLRTLKRLRDQGVINDHFKIIKPNTYLMYLGDCVDKEHYGLEVLYTLMRLKTANPDHVILVRGNHEDAYVNRTTTCISFEDELIKKGFKHRNRLHRLYDMMPPIVYLGSGSAANRTYLMCCHGGLEIGITPHALITAPDHVTFMALTKMDRADMIKALPDGMRQELERIVPSHHRRNCALKTAHADLFGYMYSNFLIDQPNKIVNDDKGCWWYGRDLTRTLLDRDGGPDRRIKSILRAHQHIGHMLQELAAHKGYFSMWDGMVLTVFSAPAIESLPPCPYDSMVKVITAEHWKDWSFTHLSHPMPS